MTPRTLARRARDWEPLNRCASTLLRALTAGRPPEWMVAHLPRVGEVVIALPGGAEARFWSRGDDWITSRVWWRGLGAFEPEAVGPFLRLAQDARVILDVGAYTGFYSVLAAAVNPRARVFAFEPNPAIAARLGWNLALNGHSRVTIVPMAVGERRGTADLHLGGPGMASSSSLASEWAGLHEAVRVAVVDLDGFASDWDLHGVDLVKMDVETMEPSVVAGMSRLLDSDRPFVFTEVLPGADERYAAMTRRLQEAHYELFLLTREGLVPETELRGPERYVNHDTTPVNHLACPVERRPEWLR